MLLTIVKDFIFTTEFHINGLEYGIKKLAELFWKQKKHNMEKIFIS
ncbi:hypothetical protein SPJ2_1335 [Streptococcus parauberis KRS-02109]|nr:hypothetical protein SPJ2_1335 [Streptococcus parauberis KRS-02109]